MPAAPFSVATTAEEAAMTLNLPAGWRCFEDSTPDGSKLRRVVDPQGMMYENEADVTRALELLPDHQPKDFDDSSHGGQTGEAMQEEDSKPSEAEKGVTEECTSEPEVDCVGHEPLVHDMAEKVPDRAEDGAAAAEQTMVDHEPPVHDAAEQVPDQAEDVASAAGQKNDGRRGRRVNPKVKALAVLELVDGDVQMAMENVKSQLQREEQLVKQSAADHAAAMAAVQKATEDMQTLGFDIQTALEAESKACDALKEVQQRQQQANKTVDVKKAALQACQEQILVVEMKAEAQDVKRQKLAELQKAVADCEKAGEEIKRQEREAREAMRQLIKENKQTSRLGAFGRRQQERNTSSSELLAGAEVPKAGLSDAGASDGSPADQVGSRPVHIKREAMQAFARQPAYSSSEPVIVLDED